LPDALNTHQTASTGLKTLWLAIVLIVIDQLTKWLANQYLTLGDPVSLFNHLNLTLVYNYGAAFSFLADMGGWQRWFFAGLAIVVSLVLLNLLRHRPNQWTAEVVAINLVLSGALGNVIDRILVGKVTDFIDFYMGSWHYATFNVADIYISLGAALYIYAELFLSKGAKQKAEA